AGIVNLADSDSDSGGGAGQRRAKRRIGGRRMPTRSSGPPPKRPRQALSGSPERGPRSPQTIKVVKRRQRRVRADQQDGAGGPQMGNAAARMLLGGGGGARPAGASQGKADSRAAGGHAGNSERAQQDDEVVLTQNPYLREVKRLLLEAVDMLELPPNPLDYLVDLLGGPDCVAEMTGRTECLVRSAGGQVEKQRRCAGVPQSQVNRYERDNFQQGRKMAAIISEAASTGTSLQADRRAQNQRRRLHITLELPWSADKAIQQFGRTHRSNQTSSPVYKLVVTEAGGERRFASAAAKRLQALGALLKADRNAMGAGSELKAFDIDNNYGRDAIKQLYLEIGPMNLNQLEGVEAPKCPGEVDYRGYFRRALASVGIAITNADQKEASVQRFLNRLLGLSLADQKLLFDYFSQLFDTFVRVAKSEGRFSDGVVEMCTENGITMMAGYPKRVDECPISGAVTDLVGLQMDRGVSFASACQKLTDWRAEREAKDASDLTAMMQRVEEHIRSRLEQQQRDQQQGLVNNYTAPDVEGIRQNRILKQKESRALSGFYKHKHSNFQLLAIETQAKYRGVTNKWFRIFRPNNCSPGVLTQQQLWDKKYTPVSLENMKATWEQMYRKTDMPVGHKDGLIMSRHVSCFLLSGAILPVWKDLLEQYREQQSYSMRTRADGSEMRDVVVVRAELANGERIVGLQPGHLDERAILELVEAIRLARHR
ncbi:hypothetical protein CYMTET_15390, partial [Cymbomonas tetramitiformis]